MKSKWRCGQTRKAVMSLVLQGVVFTTYHVSLERANVTVWPNGNTQDIAAFKTGKTHIPAAESIQEGRNNFFPGFMRVIKSHLPRSWHLVHNLFLIWLVSYVFFGCDIFVVIFRCYCVSGLWRHLSFKAMWVVLWHQCNDVLKGSEIRVKLTLILNKHSSSSEWKCITFRAPEDV